MNFPPVIETTYSVNIIKIDEQKTHKMKVFSPIQDVCTCVTFFCAPTKTFDRILRLNLNFAYHLNLPILQFNSRKVLERDANLCRKYNYE